MKIKKNVEIDKNTTSKVKKDKILIIYSCEQKNIFLQQNIVFINQFIEEFKYKYDILIFTTRDTLMLVDFDYVKVIVNSLTEKNISHVLKEENIDKIIPIDCDCSLIKSLTLKHKKIDNFFSSFYHNYGKYNFLKIAKKVGFEEKNDKIKKKHVISFVAIKDEFDNQIILDSFEKTTLGNKIIYCSEILISIDCEKKINNFVYNFGKFLKIKKYPYVLTLVIDENEKIYFDNIKYGLSDELVFSLQRQQINLVKIMLKITYKFLVFFQKNRDISALANCCNGSFSLVIDSLNKNDDKIFFLDCRDCIKEIGNFEKHILGDFILFSLGEDFIDDINNQIFFCKMCNIIAKEIGKRPLIITKKIFPIFQLINNSNIIVCNVFNEKNIKAIIKKCNFNEAYIVPTNKNVQLIELIKKLKIKVFPYIKNNDFIVFDNKKTIKFCKKSNCLFQSRKFNNLEKSIYFSCIIDNFNNIAYPTIIDYNFDSLISISYYKIPADVIHYDLFDDIKKIVLNLIKYSSSIVGLLTITFIYKKGVIYVNKIYLNNFQLLFFLNKEKINYFYKLVLFSMLGKNIKKAIEKCKTIENNEFYKKISFEYNDGQFLTIGGLTKEMIFNKFLLNKK